MYKTAILFTANDVHVAQASLMLASLRDRTRGNYSGDIHVISTGLGDEAQRFLREHEIGFYIDDLAFTKDWSAAPEIARTLFKNQESWQPDKSSRLGLLKSVAKRIINGSPASAQRIKSPEAAFAAWKNKRMSKLAILSFLNANNGRYDRVLVCDNDLFFQRDVAAVFDQIQQDRISYWQEDNAILPGTPLWRKNCAYYKATGTVLEKNLSFLDFREVNIGLLAGSPQAFLWLFEGVKSKMLDPMHLNIIMNHSWHDQDFCRVLRYENPERFQLFTPNTVVHLCNGGAGLVEERGAMKFYFKSSVDMPGVVHFAGGAWKDYSSIRDAFQVDHRQYFDFYKKTSQSP